MASQIDVEAAEFIPILSGRRHGEVNSPLRSCSVAAVSPPAVRRSETAATAPPPFRAAHAGLKPGSYIGNHAKMAKHNSRTRAILFQV